MVSRLEKLLLGITAALAINCGEEPTSEQCREGREWNGSACIAVGYDAGRDPTSEEPEPECYTHQECGDDYLCVEGSCKGIEEACRINESAPCDENSRFDGVYELITDNCSIYQASEEAEELIISLGFYNVSNECTNPGIASITASTRVCLNYDGFQSGNTIIIYESDPFPSYYFTRIIKCTPITILLNMESETRSCHEVFELITNNFSETECTDHR